MSNYLHYHDPDHKRNEAAKIKARYKQERKGAIRKLRRDAFACCKTTEAEAGEGQGVYREDEEGIWIA